MITDVEMDLVSADVAQIQQPANVRNLATSVLRLGYSVRFVSTILKTDNTF